MTDLIINGEPIMSITFDDVPSWNAVAKMSPKDKMNTTKSWRHQGYIFARQFVMRLRKEVGPTANPFLVKRALLVVKVMTARDGEMDVFNKNVKYLTDGFTDAKVWENDDWVHVPIVIFMWGGKDMDIQYKKNAVRHSAITKTIVEVHELGSLSINWEKQILPAGRETINAEI